MRHISTKTLKSTPLINKNNNNNQLSSMESLQLPAELYWDGKSEPNTPPSSELFSIVDYNIADNWMYGDDIANEIMDNEKNLNIKFIIEDAVELLSGDELVKELCSSDEEHWSNAKPQSPNTNYADDYIVEVPQPSPLNKVVFQNTLDALSGLGAEEFFAPVSTNLDIAILTQLTPPQSPPLHNSSIINNNQQLISPVSNLNGIFQQQQQPILIQAQLPLQPQQQSSFIWSQCNNNSDNSIVDASIPTFQVTDNYIQTQIVDEIVNSRAKELLDWHDEFEALSSSSTTSSSINADESISTDEDWLHGSEYFLDSAASSASTSPTHFDNESQVQPLKQANFIEHEEQTYKSQSSTSGITSAQLKKRRPYGRAIEDRKIRKKEQNKNAATRYRQKKKLEMEVVLSEENDLLTQNDELKRELSERQKEAKYLKKLLREFYDKQRQLKQQK